MNVLPNTYYYSHTDDNNRNIGLDIIAGILIIRMILGHYISYAGCKDSFLFDSLNVLYFYMPWFFYKSGMFAHDANNRDAGKSYFIKEFKKLIIPYIAFTFWGLICSIIYELVINSGCGLFKSVIHQCGGFLRYGYFSWSSHLWFLPSLFICKCLYSIILYKWNKFFVATVSLLLAILHNKFISSTGFIGGGNLFSGLFFFTMGNILSDTQYNKFWTITSITIVSLIAFVRPSFVSMFSNVLQNNGLYVLWYPFCLGGIIIINNLFRNISKASIVYSTLGEVGRNSMSFYLSHFSIAVLACKLYHYYKPNGNEWQLLCIMVICAGIILPIIADILNKRKLKWIIGKI